MTQKFSFFVLLLSLAIVMFTVGVMYNHTILDFESDKMSGKNTIVQKTGSKTNAMNGFILIYTLGYLFAAIFALFSQNYFCLLSFLSVPPVVMLYKALKSYNSSTLYERDEKYLSVLVASAKLMALFSLLMAIGLFIKFFV